MASYSMKKHKSLQTPKQKFYKSPNKKPINDVIVLDLSVKIV